MAGRIGWLKENIDRRAAVRFTYSCLASVTANSRSDQATVINLSVWGCAVRSRIAVARGDRLSLTLALSDEGLPLIVELSRVRWSGHGLVGIEFLNMAASARSRLRRRLLALREQRIAVQTPGLGARSGRWA